MQKVRRLYGQFQPEHYRLFIDTDKQNMSFSGEVEILGNKIGRPSQRITLHAKQLNIISASIVKHDKNGDLDIPLKRTLIHKTSDELRIHSQSMLMPGSYSVTIRFKGRITQPMNGIYPCYYEHQGQKEIILATQFESHHAREAFPCIDEPEAKAVFSLSLLTDPAETVLSNTPLIKQSQQNGRMLSEFSDTPKMSSYLLAFVCGKLSYREGQTAGGVTVRAYATPANRTKTAFALQTAIDCLDFYNDYFAIDYPLSKCDLVALPDFASGAMENWGLVTFREHTLLVDNHSTSLWVKQYVANVIAHELTHQWFGNLVTMRWWNDLWLNESFATLMSYVAVNHLFPEWQVWTQFVIDEQLPAFRLDSLAHTHPINVIINHPDEIRSIFDTISYEKGASILFMLMHYLGEDAFRSGLNSYLRRHAYGNTESKDLWQSWEESTAKPVAEFMNTWTTQAGFPLVKVGCQSNRLILHQERFYVNPEAIKEASVWPIPLFASDDFPLAILNGASAMLDVSGPIKLNQGRRAFFRTVYDRKLLGQLIDELDKGRLDPIDRQGLLADNFEASKAGYQSITSVLDLIEADSKEDSLIVWDVIADIIGSINRVMDNEALRQLIHPWVRRLAQTHYKRLGWKPAKQESHFDTLMRPLLIGLMLSNEDKDALTKARQLFVNSHQRPIDPDIRGVVYTSVARHGGQPEFDRLWQMHNLTDSSEERNALLAALTNFRQPQIIKQALDRINSPDVRLQDIGYWLSCSFANRFAKQLTWEWLKKNWDWLHTNLGDDMSFALIPRYAAQSRSDKQFLTDFSTFFSKHMEEGLTRTYNQAVETITWQADWRQRDNDRLMDYFKDRT